MRARFALAPLFVAAVILGSAATPRAKEIRRDPENKRGISPYMELVVKGAVVLRPPATSRAPSAPAQDAIKLKPDEMLAFYRLGEGRAGVRQARRRRQGLGGGAQQRSARRGATR